MSRLIAIVGPTASGKSDLAVQLAKKFHGYVISADSRQIYRGMDIGTGKISKTKRFGIPHFMLDIASPQKTFTVAQYQKRVFDLLQRSHDRIPFLVGGTGFYIQAIIDHITFPRVKPNVRLRKILEKKSAQELFFFLKKKDRERATTIDPQNKRRLIRAIEICTILGRVPKIESRPRMETLIIGVQKNRDELRVAIRTRLEQRFRQGLVAEVRRLHHHGLSWKRLRNFGLEYRWVSRFLENQISFQEMKEKLERDIWHYAKRQMTWFKRDKRIRWIRHRSEAEKLVAEFLRSST